MLVTNIVEKHYTRCTRLFYLKHKYLLMRHLISPFLYIYVNISQVLISQILVSSDQHTEIGCLSDILTLSCPENRTLEVTSGYYGKYYYACADGCCAPHPEFDCKELVSENRPSDWAAIKVTC